MGSKRNSAVDKHNSTITNLKILKQNFPPKPGHKRGNKSFDKGKSPKTLKGALYGKYISINQNKDKPENNQMKMKRSTSSFQKSNVPTSTGNVSSV